MNLGNPPPPNANTLSHRKPLYKSWNLHFCLTSHKHTTTLRWQNSHRHSPSFINLQPNEDFNLWRRWAYRHEMDMEVPTIGIPTLHVICDILYKPTTSLKVGPKLGLRDRQCISHNSYNKEMRQKKRRRTRTGTYTDEIQLPIIQQ